MKQISRASTKSLHVFDNALAALPIVRPADGLIMLSDRSVRRGLIDCSLIAEETGRPVAVGLMVNRASSAMLFAFIPPGPQLIVSRQ